MKHISYNRAQEVLSSIAGKTIAVVGDVMLDRYFWGSVTRVSPEAPVPVIDIESETVHLGGAANVASNLHSLGANPMLCGVVGNDNSGKLFADIMQRSGLNTQGMVTDESRSTTVKTRVIGNNQHIARLDREERAAIAQNVQQEILRLLQSADDLAGIILEDYNKGVVQRELIESIMLFANEASIPVYVDPKRDNFTAYKGATVFKPNRKEAQEALGYSLKTDNDVERAGKQLLEMLGCTNVLLTLGAQGMMLFESNGAISSVPTRARHIADVSGAGDTAIATLAACMASGATVQESSTLANFAAGIVCGEPGIVSITAPEILSAVRSHENEQ